METGPQGQRTVCGPEGQLKLDQREPAHYSPDQTTLPLSNIFEDQSETPKCFSLLFCILICESPIKIKKNRYF